MSRNSRVWFGAVTALVVLAADQASKWWVLEVLRLPELVSVPVLPVLNLTMVWNHGITFGLLTSQSAWAGFMLAAVALAVVGFLTVWLFRAERMVVAIALGAVAGGAIGNVIDRARFGAVVDFIHAHVMGWSWYVFNVADAAIVCGVAVLVLDGMRHPGKPKQDPAHDPERLAAAPGEK